VGIADAPGKSRASRCGRAPCAFRTYGHSRAGASLGRNDKERTTEKHQRKRTRIGSKGGQTRPATANLDAVLRGFRKNLLRAPRHAG
jgi:hypothetical protein